MLQRLDTTDRPEKPTDPTTRADRTPTPLGISATKVAAGALAAASAAVAASWLGVAGTVTGAVLASVVVSVTSALYSHPLERSSEAIRGALPTVARGRPEEAPRRAGVDANGELGRRRRPVRWAAVSLTAVAILVLGFGILTGVEALIGRPISSLTGHGGGGTTLSHLVPGSGGGSSRPSNGPETGGSSTAPTESPTSGAPTTAQPTQTEPTPTAPTEPTDTAPTSAQPTTGGASVAP
jgi:hypothetical protein